MFGRVLSCCLTVDRNLILKETIMFETKTDSSTLQAVFMNDAKAIRKAVAKKCPTALKTVLNDAAREEQQFQQRPDDFALRDRQ